MLATTQPIAYLSLIVDGMDQSKTQLPVVRRRDKSDDLKLIKQKIMAVKVRTNLPVLVCVCVCLSPVALPQYIMCARSMGMGRTCTLDFPR